MDRVVSVALGRPFGIQDHDIDIELFSAVDDENVLPDGILVQPALKPSPICVPLHIVSLRRICGRIFDQVYSTRYRGLKDHARDEIQATLHQELLQWRRTMPFPLPKSMSIPVPHYSAAWYDLNFYQHLLMLYRPSPLFPVLTVAKLDIVAESASMFMTQLRILQQEGRYSYNWLNLFTVFTVTLALIYTTTAQPDPLPLYLQRSTAMRDLEAASSILAIFGRKFPSATKCRDLVSEIVQMLRSQLEQGRPARRDVTNIAIASSQGQTAHAETGFPVYNTGNEPYDRLQEQLAQSISSDPFSPGNHDATVDLPNVSGAEPPMMHDFDMFTADLGNAAAEFMSFGYGASDSLDM
jgi:hypothetical protein